MAIVGRVLESQGFRVGIIAQPDWRSTADFERLGAPKLFFGDHGRQHGLDGEPLHGGPARAPRRRVHAGRRRRKAARPQRARLLAARARGVSETPIVIGGIEVEPAPYRALRLLAGEGAPLDRCSTRARTCSCSATASGRSSRSRIGSRPARSRPRSRNVRGTAFARQRGRRRLDRDRLDASRFAGSHRQASRPVRDGSGDRGGRARGGRERARRERRALHAPRADGRSRAQLHPAAELRASARRPGALRARVANPAHGVEPGQRARARAAARRQRTSGSIRRRFRSRRPRWIESTSCRISAGRIPRTATRRSRPTR